MIRGLIGMLVLAMAAPGAAAAGITVSAASSLSNAMREVARAYEASQPGERVRLNFAASDALVAQVLQGAPVDVLVCADQQAMDRAAPLLAAGSRRDFARNTLVVAVPAASGLRLHSVADLAQPAVQRLSTGNPGTVPAGRYARAALEQAGMWQVLAPRFVFGNSVRQSLDYVARGEVDAGIVYATDVAAQHAKVRVALPLATPAPILYPLAVLRAAPNPAGARRFAGFLLSRAGQAILQRHGFGQP